MRHKSVVLLVVILVAFFAPVIPAYAAGGPYIPTPFHGLTIGLQVPQCGTRMLASVFYLLTEFGPNIELPTPCNETYPPV